MLPWFDRLCWFEDDLPLSVRKHPGNENRGSAGCCGDHRHKQGGWPRWSPPLALFKTTMDEVWRTGVFPKKLKKARLMLLPKPGKSSNSSPAYQSICLMDLVGKAVEW